jgi:hypothetical protein
MLYLGGVPMWPRMLQRTLQQLCAWSGRYYVQHLRGAVHSCARLPERRPPARDQAGFVRVRIRVLRARCKRASEAPAAAAQILRACVASAQALEEVSCCHCAASRAECSMSG